MTRIFRGVIALAAAFAAACGTSGSDPDLGAGVAASSGPAPCRIGEHSRMNQLDRPGNLQACTARCAERDQQSCAILGMMYLRGAGTDADPERALGLLREACDAGVALGCGALGAMYGSGVGVTEDRARARALYAEACQGRDALSCESLGGQHLSEGELEQALHWYQRACELENASACTALGMLLASGITGKSEDTARALSLWQHGCDREDGLACYQLARWYAQNPEAVSDWNLPSQLMRKACTLGVADACDPDTGAPRR